MISSPCNLDGIRKKTSRNRLIRPGYQDTTTVAKNLKNNTVWASSDLGLNGINKNKDKKTTLPSAKKHCQWYQIDHISPTTEKPELRFRGWDLSFFYGTAFTIINTASGVMCALPMYTNRFGVHGALYIYIYNIYKCFVRLSIICCFFRGSIWLVRGEKSTTLWVDSQKQRPHTLANCCLEQRLLYWWSAPGGFLFSAPWMKDYTETIRNS